MKILHVTNAYPYPDVPEYGVFVKEQIDALKRAGISCDVLFVNGRAGGPSAYLRAIGQLRRAASNYDVIHCHHLYSSYVAALACVRKPVVLSFQNEWPHEVVIGNRLIQVAGCSFGAWYADRVIFKSPIPARFRDQDKFVHLPNGVDYDAFTITSKAAAREQLGLDQDAVYALFVSSKDQFRRQKRYDRFAETLAIVRARNPGLDLRELVMVNQERSKVSAFFNAADVHLLCSDFEGSPNSVKEALCTGLAVIATPVGNTPEMLDSVPGCAISTGFGADELAGLVEQAIVSGVQRESIRAAFVAQGLSQGAATANLSALYSGLSCRQIRSRK